MREFDVAVDGRGMRLRVCAWGPARGRPVVILHGFLEQGAAWDGVAGPLAARLGRPVYAPDHRGHGLSGHVGAGGFYHFWDYVADLDALLRALDAGAGVEPGTAGAGAEPGTAIDLVGHSMGGTVAALYASLRPERIRRLVLAEGLGPPDDGASLDRPRRALDDRADPPAHPVLRDAADAAGRMRRHNPSLSEAEALRLATRATRPVPGGVTWTWDALHRARSPQRFSAAAFADHLRAIRAPALLLRGGASPYAALPDIDAREAAVPGATRATLDGAGHLLHHDRPEALTDLLAGWLGPDALPGRAGAEGSDGAAGAKGSDGAAGATGATAPQDGGLR